MAQKDTRPIGGTYRIGQILSAGPVLTTCTAYDSNTNDIVGLSILEFPPQLPYEIIQQHLQRIEQRRMVQSPHVLHIHRWGIEGKRAFIATDSPRGVTLSYVLDHENVDTRRAIDLTKQIALGLSALHQQNITGIDLRPQLITVDTIGLADRVQIDDIGLRALLKASGYDNSRSPEEIGYFDPRYMPPEYMNNDPIGPWSDIYQLGLVLFTIIAGRPPFVGRNAAETGILQNASPIPPIKYYAHEAPETLQDIVNHTMAKDPAQRFSSVQPLLSALEEVYTAMSRSTGRQKPLEDKTLPPSIGLTSEMLSLESSATVNNAPTKFDQSEITPTETAADTGVYAYLHFEKVGEKTHRIPITQNNVIVGRIDPKRGVNPDIDLSAFDVKMTVSRQHARIRYENSLFSIEDLRSRNKTRLKESPLTPFKPEPLQHGDMLFFGSVRLRFAIAGMAPLPPDGK